MRLYALISTIASATLQRASSPGDSGDEPPELFHGCCPPRNDSPRENIDGASRGSEHGHARALPSIPHRHAVASASLARRTVDTVDIAESQTASPDPDIDAQDERTRATPVLPAGVAVFRGAGETVHETTPPRTILRRARAELLMDGADRPYHDSDHTSSPSWR